MLSHRCLKGRLPCGRRGASVVGILHPGQMLTLGELVGRGNAPQHGFQVLVSPFRLAVRLWVKTTMMVSMVVLPADGGSPVTISTAMCNHEPWEWSQVAQQLGAWCLVLSTNWPRPSHIPGRPWQGKATNIDVGGI